MHMFNATYQLCIDLTLTLTVAGRHALMPEISSADDSIAIDLYLVHSIWNNRGRTAKLCFMQQRHFPLMTHNIALCIEQIASKNLQPHCPSRRIMVHDSTMPAADS